MPPKLTKKELEEQQRQEEERKKQEEEEKIKKEEEKKYKPIELPTGLTLYLTEYFVTECMKEKNPKPFIVDFVYRYLKVNQIFDNFRKIDLDYLIEFHINNLQFSIIENQFTVQQTTVFINLMWTILMSNDPKYKVYEKQKLQDESQDKYDFERQKAMRKAKKMKDEDFDLFKSILGNHSIDKEPKQKRYFDSITLNKIIDYARKGYFAHFNLIKFAIQNDQRDEDYTQTIYVDDTVHVPYLSEFQEINKEEQKDQKPQPSEVEKNQQQQPTENEDKSKPENSQPKQTDEEQIDLDPTTLQLIKDKIKEAEEKVEQQLQNRQNQLNEKYNDITQPKKGNKK